MQFIHLEHMFPRHLQKRVYNNTNYAQRHEVPTLQRWQHDQVKVYSACKRMAVWPWCAERPRIKMLISRTTFPVHKSIRHTSSCIQHGNVISRRRLLPSEVFWMILSQPHLCREAASSALFEEAARVPFQPLTLQRRISSTSCRPRVVAQQTGNGLRAA
ncbi:hypothetical protein BC835DRAFT_910957 [Cytidiella melzeri]|nr:hypothetical protein BC835DRAFT_910957 [Cytidiella melzeri]